MHLNCGTCWEGCKATLKTCVCLQRVSNTKPFLLNSAINAYGNTLKIRSPGEEYDDYFQKAVFENIWLLAEQNL